MHPATKDHWATALLALATALTAATAGQIHITHAHYRSWQHISPPDMTAVHDNWATTVDTAVLPLAIASATATLATLALKHSRLPWWTVTTTNTIQAAVLVTSFTMWAKWQHQLGNGGYVRNADNTLSAPYERIMDTHWLRITLLITLAAATLAMLIRATTTTREPRA
nr:hypothetical protein [Kibdelosporangium sp. MJ126-NF4]CEL13779.1 hypothetical protein [Kibdelosporangium sp. MJ126-NF4]CTQ88147.1 hypothetical protein [Kibdelosporangium sp. MJ126-NF4]